MVVTDGTLNFAMYTYQCDLMGWSGSGDGFYATIGYNLEGLYQNHQFSGTSSAKDIACQSSADDGGSVGRRQASSSWFNQVYQLPSAVDPIQQLRAECLTLEILDIQSNGDIAELSRSLGACPPSLAQVLLDFQFTFNGYVSTESQCYTYIFAAGSFGISSLICCYSPA